MATVYSGGINSFQVAHPHSYLEASIGVFIGKDVVSPIFACFTTPFIFALKKKRPEH